jgi:CubicO group peptidase (beta-lactamase class C family)
MKHGLLFLFLFLTLAGTAQGPALQEIFDDNELMGMSVLFMCDGEIDGIYNYGIKDYTRDLAVDDSTMYRIASISKAITATGAMALVDQGLLDLDADISDYLGFTARNPLYPDEVVTVRMLLSHTSSIQDGSGYSGFLGATYASDNNLPPIQELLDPTGDYFTSNIWRTEQPGTWFTYSNLNYGVLATVMESASGTRFDLLMEQLLFEPMGLACTYNVAHIEDINDLAVLYRNQGGWTPQVDNYQGVAPVGPALDDYTPGGNGLRFAPQGGLRSSVHDLGRLMQLHINLGYDPVTEQQLISTEVMEAMHETQWTDNGSNGDDYFNLFNSWTLGLQRITDTGDTVLPNAGSENLLGHPGEAYGLISDWFFAPQGWGMAGSGVIFMTNGAFNGYAFGDISSWYSVEEEVFSVWEQDAMPACIVSVDESVEVDYTLVYPNPASSGTQVTVGIETERLMVFNLQGQLIEEIAVQDQRAILPELATGSYLIAPDSSDLTSAQRLIIE